MVIVILHLFLVSSLKVSFGFVIPTEDFCNLDRENRGFLNLGNFNTDNFGGFCHRDAKPFKGDNASVMNIVLLESLKNIQSDSFLGETFDDRAPENAQVWQKKRTSEVPNPLFHPNSEPKSSVMTIP